MASYNVGASEVGAWEKTLTATTVDTVTFTQDLDRVEILNEGTVGLYVTVDGSTPTVGAATAFYVPPAGIRTVPSGELGGTVVKLISSSTPKYSVSRAV